MVLTPAYTRLPGGGTRSFSTGVVKLRLHAREYPVHHDLLYDGSNVYREAVDSTGGSPCAVLDIPNTFSHIHVDFFLCMLYNVDHHHVDPDELHFEPDTQLEFFKFMDPSPWVYKVSDAKLRTHSYFYECDDSAPRPRHYLETLVLLDRDFRTTMPLTHHSAKMSMQKAALYWGTDFFSVFASRDLLLQLQPDTILDVWHATMWPFTDLDTVYRAKGVQTNPDDQRTPAGALTSAQLREHLCTEGLDIVPMDRPAKAVHVWASQPFRYKVPHFEFPVKEGRTVVPLTNRLLHSRFKNPALEINVSHNELTVWFCGDMVTDSYEASPPVHGRLCPAYLKGRVSYPPSQNAHRFTISDWTHSVTCNYYRVGGDLDSAVCFEGDVLLMRH